MTFQHKTAPQFELRRVAVLAVVAASALLTACLERFSGGNPALPIYAVGTCQLDKMLPSTSKEWITAPGKITIEGWGYDGIVGDIPAVAKVQLRDVKGVMVLASDKAERFDRPDVAAFFKQDALLKAGLRVVIDATTLPVGEYKLSVSMFQPTTSLLCETERVLVLKAPAAPA